VSRVPARILALYITCVNVACCSPISDLTGDAMLRTVRTLKKAAKVRKVRLLVFKRSQPLRSLVADDLKLHPSMQLVGVYLSSLV
jgi:hypothetical protein